MSYATFKLEDSSLDISDLPNPQFCDYYETVVLGSKPYKSKL